MRILFEQLNIKNDVFSQVMVVLFFVICSQNDLLSNVHDVVSMKLESIL